MIRGQLNVAEQSALSAANAYVLGRLLACGWLTRLANGVVVPTDALWLQLGVADPPSVTYSAPPHPGTSSPITVSGTGDAGDTITLYDNGVLRGTGTVGADGTWSIVVHLTVGHHDMTATQTVNSLPHVGLTSAVSRDLDVYVYPGCSADQGDPGTRRSREKDNSSPVTVSGTGMPRGYSVTLYDGSRSIASMTRSRSRRRSFTLNLSVGTHSLTATQTSTSFPNYGKFTSAPSIRGSVTVYAAVRSVDHVDDARRGQHGCEGLRPRRSERRCPDLRGDETGRRRAHRPDDR